LGVSPDGSQVVFEVTDFTESPGPSHVLSDEQKGIFAVRSDGTGLRRLAPASRESPFSLPFFGFSPNGRTIAYTDRGPSRDNEDAIQIFTLDLVTGTRTQLTELPPTVSRGTYNPLFNNDQTIAFFTHA
jgi:Tol biopolymer transport system component